MLTNRNITDKMNHSDDSPDVLARVDMQTKITNFNFTLGLNDNTSDEYYNFTHSFCDQDENEFIVYGVVPTNQSKECSETTCECYETLLFLIFPTLPMNKTVLRCASLASDGSLMVSSEAKALSLVPRAAHVNSKLHGKRLRCKTSPLAGLGLDVLYSNEEEIKVVNNNNCWDASDKQCKQCDQLAVVCQVEEINCFPEQVPVYNGTRPGDVYCSLVNVEQIHILNISKNGNLLRSIPSPLGIHNFGQFIRLSVNTDAINVTFGTASCEDEGEYSIELSNETRTEFFVWVVSNAEMPILNVISPPKLNQNLKMTCTAMLGRGLGRTERTQVVLQRRKNGEAFEEYEATHMSDCTTSPCVCFVEAEYSVLLTDSWNETDVRCALKNTSTNLIEEDLTNVFYGRKQVCDNRYSSGTNLQTSKWKRRSGSKDH
ncbi:hypothetical protein MAR_014588 [Mya arenaria]|uniref:Uncharacterized protein n=1 Tax=Mya arenaria TaxID=6604 RepID=A0ABY7G6A1_MYAAR|nr:hypothetical protein MAR_014588 [Mya arenaria]